MEACALAGELELQGRAVLQLAQQLAVDADVEIGRGQQFWGAFDFRRLSRFRLGANANERRWAILLSRLVEC